VHELRNSPEALFIQLLKYRRLLGRALVWVVSRHSKDACREDHLAAHHHPELVLLTAKSVRHPEQVRT
jgi:hypothetical protein